jgi:hypothetical protein
MKLNTLRKLIKEEISREMSAGYKTSEWPQAIHNFITNELSSDEAELYLVIKALEKTTQMFKDEAGSFDPDFHYDA